MDLESGHHTIQIFFIVLWIMMPAYLANTIAVLTGGKYPIDQGKMHSDGNRILGDGKTWSGLIGGTLGGIIIGFLLLNFGDRILFQISHYCPSDQGNKFFGSLKIGDDFCYSANGKELWGENHLFVFFLLSFGALFGDMVASFYKRRQNLQRGDKFPILDMYDFVFMSLLLCLIFQRDWLLSWFLDGWRPIFTILVLTPFLHRGVNIIGYKLGVKKEPW